LFDFLGLPLDLLATEALLDDSWAVSNSESPA